MAEEKKRVSFFTIAVIIGVVILLNVGGSRDKFESWLSTKTEEVVGSNITHCLHDRGTMTIGRMHDALEPTNDVTKKYARVFVNGQDRGLYVDGSEVVVTPNRDKITIVYAFNSSSYYASKSEEFIAPCSSAFASSEFGDAHKIYKSANEDGTNITGSWRCNNPIDGTKISSSNSVDMDASVDETITCEIGGIQNEAYSPEAGPAVCLEYSSTQFTRIYVDGAESVPVPSSFEPNDGSNSTACFIIDPIIGRDGVDYTLIVEPSASYSASDINQWLIDQDWYKNTQTGQIEIGLQNNKQEDVGSTYIVTNTITGG